MITSINSLRDNKVHFRSIVFVIQSCHSKGQVPRVRRLAQDIDIAVAAEDQLDKVPVRVSPAAGADGGANVIIPSCVRTENVCDKFDLFIFVPMCMGAERQQKMQSLRLGFEDTSRTGSVDVTSEELLLAYQRAVVIGLAGLVIVASDASTDSDRAEQSSVNASIVDKGLGRGRTGSGRA